MTVVLEYITFDMMSLYYIEHISIYLDWNVLIIEGSQYHGNI